MGMGGERRSQLECVQLRWTPAGLEAHRNLAADIGVPACRCAVGSSLCLFPFVVSWYLTTFLSNYLGTRPTVCLPLMQTMSHFLEATPAPPRQQLSTPNDHLTSS